MAYVAVSGEVKNSIRSTIQGLRNTELNSLASLDSFDTDVKNSDSLKQMLIDRCWNPVADLRERLTPFNRNVKVLVEAKTNYVVGNYERTVKRTIEMGEMALPCVASFEHNYWGVRKSFELTCEDHEALAPLRDIMVARDECTQRWAAVETQVMTFIEKCKSLNEAVKLWPDLRRYIDDEYIERLDKKVERTKPEKSAAADALKAMDVDLVNSSVVLARMAGAQV